MHNRDLRAEGWGPEDCYPETGEPSASPAGSTPEDGDFYCPECGSFDVEEIAYEDDFGSMECRQCKYQGGPGEDFPAYREPKE